MSEIPLVLQILNIALPNNQLTGPLPSSWRNLTEVCNKSSLKKGLEAHEMHHEFEVLVLLLHHTS